MAVDSCENLQGRQDAMDCTFHSTTRRQSSRYKILDPRYPPTVIMTVIGFPEWGDERELQEC